MSAAKKTTPKKAKPVNFRIRADPGSKVFLVGDFNQWDAAATPMTDQKKNGEYTVAVPLAAGSYEYKFVINETWCVDPACADWVQNCHGSLNSVCKI